MMTGLQFRNSETRGWRWRQKGPPKLWYPTATLYGVTTRRPGFEYSWSWKPEISYKNVRCLQIRSFPNHTTSETKLSFWRQWPETGKVAGNSNPKKPFALRNRWKIGRIISIILLSFCYPKFSYCYCICNVFVLYSLYFITRVFALSSKYLSHCLPLIDNLA
jgi:hypothetical protein